MQFSDFSVTDSLYREFDEEAQVVLDGKVVNFRNEKGNLIISKMKKYISITPRAFIKDDRSKVGKVHVGIICKILPKMNSIKVKIRKADPNRLTYKYVSPKQFLQQVTTKKIKPEYWTQEVFKNEIEI